MSNQNETPKPIMATDVMFEDGSNVAQILADRTMWLMALCRRVEDVEKRLSAMTPEPGPAEDVTLTEQQANMLYAKMSAVEGGDDVDAVKEWLEMYGLKIVKA